jgi:hypothetical protein
MKDAIRNNPIRWLTYAAIVWHTMMIPLVLDLPSYLILRRYNIYYQPLDVLNDIYLFVIWIVFIIAMLLILPRYKKYLAELSGSITHCKQSCLAK